MIISEYVSARYTTKSRETKERNLKIVPLFTLIV